MVGESFFPHVANHPRVQVATMIPGDPSANDTRTIEQQEPVGGDDMSFGRS